MFYNMFDRGFLVINFYYNSVFEKFLIIKPKMLRAELCMAELVVHGRINIVRFYQFDHGCPVKLDFDL